MSLTQVILSQVEATIISESEEGSVVDVSDSEEEAEEQDKEKEDIEVSFITFTLSIISVWNVHRYNISLAKCKHSLISVSFCHTLHLHCQYCFLSKCA